MLVKELDGLEETEGLIDRPANRQIVDGGGADSTGGIHDKETTQGDSILVEDAKLACNRLVQIGNQGKMAGSQAALLPGLLGPGEMAVLRVHAASVDFGAELVELVDAVAKGIELGRADKRATPISIITLYLMDGTSRGGRRGGWSTCRGDRWRRLS